jgi:hypothetical protein
MLHDTESFIRLRADVAEACAEPSESIRHLVIDDSVGTAAAWVLHNGAIDAEPIATLKQGLRSRTTLAGVGVLPPWWGRSGYASTVPATPLVDGELLIPGLPSFPLAALTVIALLAAIAGLTVSSRRSGLHRQAARHTCTHLQRTCLSGYRCQRTE